MAETKIFCSYTKLAAIGDLKPNPANPNRHPDSQVDLLAKLIMSHGWRHPVTVSRRSGCIVSGHCRLLAAKKLGLEHIPVDEQDFASEAEEMAVLVADNKIPELSETDGLMMADILCELDQVNYPLELTALTPEEIEDYVVGPTEPNPQDDVIPEPPKKAKTNTGDLYILGNHRLMCGDATSEKDFKQLMGREKAILLYADPPYGMGKERNGIANDNLYREKLDIFQMQWWRVVRPYLEDNASAYIWGNAEDLWRLWYCGGLKESERLTFRNRIVWDKQGEGNPTLRVCGATFNSDRRYTRSETMLFFMLGEQGFNNNADNYWNGWEPIRAKLLADCEKMGWGAKDIKSICGVGMYGHWFTKSQWTFIPKEHYKKLQTASREHDAFKREYDVLKREYDATRAYFDNTQENMTDVWKFSRVQGVDRQGHATPKPVEMVCRALKSSSPDGELVIDPFLGSGTTLIACEKLNRRCFGMEIDPLYTQVCIERWQQFTGKDAILESTGQKFVDICSHGKLAKVG